MKGLRYKVAVATGLLVLVSWTPTVSADHDEIDKCRGSVDVDCWYWCYDSVENTTRKCQCSLWLGDLGCVADLNLVQSVLEQTGVV